MLALAIPGSLGARLFQVCRETAQPPRDPVAAPVWFLLMLITVVHSAGLPDPLWCPLFWGWPFPVPIICSYAGNWGCLRSVLGSYPKGLQMEGPQLSHRRCTQSNEELAGRHSPRKQLLASWLLAAVGVEAVSSGAAYCNSGTRGLKGH